MMIHQQFANPFSNPIDKLPHQIQIGSWGTPELELTERISDFFGGQRTPEGGVHLFGTPTSTPPPVPSPPTQTSPLIGPPSGNTLGAQTTQKVVNNQPTSGQPSAPGDTKYQQYAKMAAEGSLNPSQQSEWQQMQAQFNQSRGPSEGDINAVYDPTMGYLNQAEANVRGQQPDILTAAQQAYETAISELTGSKTRNQDTITQNVTTATNRKDDALSAARRMYEELRRGYSQRFGGSTSAGQAASELSSVEQQRQMGQTTRQFGDTMQQVEQQKLQLDQDFQTGSAKILQYKTESIRQANTDFQNKLLDIQGKRAETESAKAQYRLQALTDLRNQAYQASQQAQQYTQALQQQQQQQQADLQSYAQKLLMSGQGSTSAINQFMGNTTTSPTSGLTVGSSGGQNTQPNYTGIIGRKAEDLTGQMANTVRQFNPQTGQYDYVTADRARAGGY